MELIITEVNGWSKVLEISKAITRLGSASSVDIQLHSKDIAPLQLQILSNPDLPTGCRILNLVSERLEVKSNGASYPIPPYSTYDVNNGDEIQLGEYRVAFRLPLTTTLLRSSKIIQASLTFPDALLQPDLNLYGRLVIKNSGDRKACQFQAQLKGFPQDCFHIDPIPLLYPGAQEEVQVQLIHKITYPQSGLYDLLLSISAPEFYPGEEVVIKQGIFVAPVFRQEIEILDDIHTTPTIFKEEVQTGETSDAFETIDSIPAIQEARISPPISPDEDSAVDQENNQIQEKMTASSSQDEAVTPSINTSEVKTEEPVETFDLQAEVAAEANPSEPVGEDQGVEARTEAPQPEETGQQDLQDKNTEDEIAADKAAASVKNDLDLTKVKVVRTQAENFWTEK